MSALRNRLERGIDLLNLLTWDLDLRMDPARFSCHLGESEACAGNLLGDLRLLGYAETTRPSGAWRITELGHEVAMKLARQKRLGPAPMGPTGGRRTGSAVCGDRPDSIASSAPGPAARSCTQPRSTAVRTPDGSPGGRRASRSLTDWQGMERSASLAPRQQVPGKGRTERRSR